MPATARDIIEPLRNLAHDAAPHLPGFTGKTALSGARGPVRFILTEDHDGQIELSLSLPGPKKPTDAHVAAFFRALGTQPLHEELESRQTRHFVMTVGTRQ